MYLVSSCLLGTECKYDGKSNYNQDVVDFLQNRKYCEFCPEVMGGLPVPRPKCEIKDGRVITEHGEDVTEYFEKGAESIAEDLEDLAMMNMEPIQAAILKSRSPSCGSGKIYDGTFTGKLVDGDGITAARLKAEGIKVITENELDQLDELETENFSIMGRMDLGGLF